MEGTPDNAKQEQMRSGTPVANDGYPRFQPQTCLTGPSNIAVIQRRCCGPNNGHSRRPSFDWRKDLVWDFAVIPYGPHEWSLPTDLQTFPSCGSRVRERG